MSVRFRVGLGMVAALFAVTPVAGQSVARVTVGHNGAQPDGSHGVGVVSGDGRFVAFVSQATNLVASDTNGGAADVFVRDLAAATTTLVSLASDGLQRSGHSGALYNGGINITTQEHDISNDGRFVVFMSRAALVPADTGECTIPPDVAPANCPDIYLRDRQTNETVRISVAAGGANPNGPSLRPRISGDGRFVVFESSATNLVAGQTGIFLADRNTGTLSHVGQGLSPSISDNGALIGFLSTSSQLVAEPDPVACQPFPGDTQIVVCFRPFIFDRVLGETRRVPMPAIATEGVQPGSTPLPYTVRVEASSVVPSADGLSVAVGVRTSSTVRRNGIPIIDDRGWIYDRVRGRIAFDQIHLTPTAWTGSLLAYQAYTQGLLGVSTDVWAVGLVDQGPGLHETLPGGSTAALMGNVSDSGRFATYRTIAAVTGEPPIPRPMFTCSTAITTATGCRPPGRRFSDSIRRSRRTPAPTPTPMASRTWPNTWPALTRRARTRAIWRRAPPTASSPLRSTSRTPAPRRHRWSSVFKVTMADRRARHGRSPPAHSERSPASAASPPPSRPSWNRVGSWSSIAR